MTDHPCKGMTKAQREAFERIAVSQPGLAHPRTIATLLQRGLIVRDADEIVGRDRFGTITVPRYYVPLPIHAEWCEWCSEQPENSDMQI